MWEIVTIMVNTVVAASGGGTCRGVVKGDVSGDTDGR